MFQNNHAQGGYGHRAQVEVNSPANYFQQGRYVKIFTKFQLVDNKIKYFLSLDLKI